MDTLYCRQRWLLWTVLIVLLNHCREVSGSGRQCPQGQLLHSISQYLTCCYPTRCGVGEHVKPCAINGTQDTCQMCGPYHNQSLRTSSFTMEPCTIWPLNKECKSVYNPTGERNIKDEQTRRCMCNIELGKMFSLPESEFPGAPMDSYCQRRRVYCKPGQEPVVDGGCRPCQVNYFQPNEGFRLCEPKTNCSMLGLSFVHWSNATSDHICSEPDLITTPKPYVPATLVIKVTASQKPPVASSESTTPPSTTTEVTVRSDLSRDPGRDDNNVTWPVVGVVLFLILLVAFILLVMLWRKRKGMSVWVCSSSKDYSDPEKNYSQGSIQVGQRGKHVMGDGCVIPQHLTPDGDKMINNNISGGVPCGLGYLPNGHPNGNVHHAHFNQTEHGNGDVRSFYPNPLQYHLVQTARPGILRNANHNVVYGQSQGTVRDRSIDSIGQEKLQVHVDELEANQDLGENDPLLVPDHLRGLPPLQIQNLGASVGNSPPVMQAGMNPLQLLAYNGPGRTNFGAAFVHSGTSSPPVQPNAPIVTYAPATGVVTFTRSTSVIASPEGEVDEDEIEARLPRLSQLLAEGDNSSVIEPDHGARDIFRADSPGRETTQQLRAPSQRLIKDLYHSPRNGNPITQQTRHQGNNPTQRPGFSPAVVGPVPQRDPHLHQPDHRIMNLKEQQLAESLHSTSNRQTTDGQQTYEPDLSATDTPKAVVSSPEEAQQTELKTQLPLAADSDFSTSAGANLKTTKVGQDTTEPKDFDIGRGDQKLMNRKGQVSGGSSGQTTLEKKPMPGSTNFQNVSDRKRVPSGGSNSSGQNTLERQRAPSGDQQRPCIKNSSAEEIDNTAKKPHRYNRTVSFEEEDSPQPSNRQRGPLAEPRHLAKSANSPDKADTNSRYRGPLRSVSDPEQKITSQVESDSEETERKCVSLEYNASDGSSKTSVNSDVSGTDSSSGSPCRTALYRRSQSENAQCSSESAHKPPPRSMSEEKPQKLDRPIAKVKPMPASDNAVNQLPFEVSEETGLEPHLPVAAVVSNNNAAVFLGHNNDESDHENNSEGNHSTASALEEEDEDNREAEDVEED